MKKQVKNSQKRKTDYTPVEKNIYKTGNRYRVRVGRDSINASTLKEARQYKKILKGNVKSDSIW
jgi:hypothetical protein